MTIGAAELEALGKTPRVRLIEAVAAAQARGLRLRSGELGVMAGADWRVDRGLQPNGVSLAGAVLLHLQPQPVPGEDPLETAARALEVSLAWVTGAEAAWSGEPMGVEWLARPDGQHYQDGYAAGTEVLQIFVPA